MTTQGSRRTTSKSTTESTETNGHPLLGNLVDLDAMIDAVELKPVPMKLGGQVYEIRTDLTNREMAEYWRLTGLNEDIEALTVIVVSNAADLSAYLDSLPQKHVNLVVQRILVAAGLLAETGELGESQASSQA